MKWLFFFLLLFTFSPLTAQITFENNEEALLPLVNAVKQNNIKEVKRLVEAGTPINSDGFSFNQDPIDIAVENKYKEIAVYLLEKGATSRRNFYNAVLTGDLAWVKLLLSYKFYDDEAVLAAVESKNLELVKFLIENGFKVNFAQKRRLGLFRKEYVSPIEVAVYNHQEAISLELVKAGVPIEEAYDLAVGIALQSLCLKLIDRGEKLDELMLLSFERGNRVLVEYCIKKGAKPTAVTKEGLSAYHLSIENGSMENVLYCLQTLKIDPHSLTSDHTTPLMLAAKGKSLPVFDYILKLPNTNVNAVDGGGSTALFYAIHNEGNPKIIELLLQNGATINHQNFEGNTPVMEALRFGDWDQYVLLKNNGADLTLKNNVGQNVISYLIGSSFYTTGDEVMALINAGVDPNVVDNDGENLAYYAMSRKNMQLLELMKTKGVSFDAKNNRGVRPDCSDEQIIRFVIENGGNINREDTWHESYLSSALKKGNYEFAIYLIHKGADVNWNGDGDAPIVYDMVKAENLEAVKILAENGAFLNVKDRWGHFLMEEAMEKNNPVMIAYLRSKGAKTQKEYAEIEQIRTKELGQIPTWIQQKNLAPILTTYKKYSEVSMNLEQMRQIAQLSVEQANLEMLQYLVETHKMDLNMQMNFQQQNLLHIAAGYGNMDIIRLLVNKGVDTQKKDAYDKLPIDYSKSKEVKKYFKALGK